MQGALEEAARDRDQLQQELTLRSIAPSPERGGAGPSAATAGGGGGSGGGIAGLDAPSPEHVVMRSQSQASTPSMALQARLQPSPVRNPSLMQGSRVYWRAHALLRRPAVAMYAIGTHRQGYGVCLPCIERPAYDAPEENWWRGLHS